MFVLFWENWEICPTHLGYIFLLNFFPKFSLVPWMVSNIFLKPKRIVVGLTVVVFVVVAASGRHLSSKHMDSVYHYRFPRISFRLQQILSLSLKIFLSLPFSLGASLKKLSFKIHRRRLALEVIKVQCILIMPPSFSLAQQAKVLHWWSSVWRWRAKKNSLSLFLALFATVPISLCKLLLFLAFCLIFIFFGPLNVQLDLNVGRMAFLCWA